MVLYLWLGLDDEENSLWHNFIKLEADKTIVWGQNTRPAGHWMYHYTEDVCNDPGSNRQYTADFAKGPGEP